MSGRKALLALTAEERALFDEIAAGKSAVSLDHPRLEMANPPAARLLSAGLIEPNDMGWARLSEAGQRERERLEAGRETTIGLSLTLDNDAAAKLFAAAAREPGGLSALVARWAEEAAKRGGS